MFDELDPATLRRRAGVKWDRAAPGVLPAWIADMDFPVTDPVREALARHLESGPGLGYPAWDNQPEKNPLVGAFVERMEHRYSLALDPAHVRVFTELIQTLQVVLHLATRPGDAVVLHTPAYPPFLKTVTDMGRRLVTVPVTDGGEGWAFDSERLAEAVARHDCRVLVLVNPHNPTGRVMTREELSAVAEIAARHDLLVVADEIHAELTYEPHRHIPFASLDPETAGRTVTLSSASKAFNLAGLRCSVAHIGDGRVRRALEAQPPQLYGDVSSLSVLATVAAWQEGEPWLEEARRTLARNRRMVAESLPPGIRHHAPEATYLAWLDCRELGLGADPAAFFLEEAGVMLSPGPDFGAVGEGFARLNFATSKAVLEEILDRMRNAVERRGA
ncbi:PatB family C-S lyase [Streptomyces sp. MST-110588]|uniref:MalY/PatB family protein n=1 Tax=Streptomyces sp. MST-110588 TaxID=2833628 RepID=UPI001F5D0BF3|nr:PatB family C-S lyase [Streptomyces sp. MST-110588]UNO41625.1 PatB family C-S lyase [Streptomyces sp. MST-110588]